MEGQRQGISSGISIVDIHTHFGTSPARDLDLSLEHLRAIMQRHGIRQALTYSLKAVQFDFAAGNEETWQVCQTEPRLHPVAVVDPRRYLGCEEEILRRAAQGFVAFRFFPHRQGWSIESLYFARLLKAVARTGKPAIVSASSPGDATRLLRLAGESEATIVMCGLGYATIGEALAAMQEETRLFLEMHVIPLPFQVEVIMEAVGADRLLFGSMSPLHYTSPTLRMIEQAEIPLSAKALILGGNARRLFRLPEVEVG